MKILFNLILGLLIVSFSISQPKYRTFSQNDLSLKKAKAGKVVSSNTTFVFHNDELTQAANGIQIRFNSSIISILDSGGFSSFTFLDKNKTVRATGKTVSLGDSAVLSFNVAKKAQGTQANFWFWLVDGVQAGVKRTELAGSYTPNFIQPNGGNVLEYIYKKIINRPAGLVIGKVTDTLAVGWIRYMKADRMYFPHTGTAGGFDEIATGSSQVKPFIRELKNPKVKKHDNRLLGEVHALKLAIIANDSGATEPTDTTALGDLLYNDLSNPTDPCNGLKIREITYLADSILTYYHHFSASPVIYAQLDSAVSRINRAFDGPYIALSLTPFLLKGTHSVDEVPFIHPNPLAFSKGARHSRFSIEDEMPEKISLYQNYPNPFNPSTHISFSLPEAGLVTLKVYDMLGREVATLLDRENLDAGDQWVEFIADNLSSGVYFYKLFVSSTELLTAGSYTIVKKMLLIR
ncbi:MAG: T9SS type A sorting domain-containing protein [Bacteroidota bacterium]|nr:T9SS type A sorting domain-containing protein [Bacteroidota bacterium]